MLKELKIAIDKQQQVSVRTKDGNITVGLPKQSIDPERIKIYTQNGVVSVPINDINHVLRIIGKI
ncbi:hypothetical protein P4H67_25950 [Paenibacillus lautus]|uniref:hypothetical protein n=1 Tax=Paenibacillus lautus TaxID=1401 RepID=UPI002DB79292|nr:hypothetical protein [Paenibacillus lautus]MEC0310203.1 hypothetical protein [Paenibacillus lautus]